MRYRSIVHFLGIAESVMMVDGACRNTEVSERMAANPVREIDL
jgi:hypothetical protein